MKRVTKFALAGLGLLAGGPSLQAVEVRCTDHSTTFIYQAADLVAVNGRARGGGIGNIVAPGLDASCFVELTVPASTASAADLRIDVVHDSYWEGIVNPFNPHTGPNAKIFNVEMDFGPLGYEIIHYRLGDMHQKVLWTDKDGRYGVDAYSRARPITTPTFHTDRAVDSLQVRVCEVRGGADVVIKEVLIESDLYDPDLCN